MRLTLYALLFCTLSLGSACSSGSESAAAPGADGGDTAGSPGSFVDSGSSKVADESAAPTPDDGSPVGPASDSGDAEQDAPKPAEDPGAGTGDAGESTPDEGHALPDEGEADSGPGEDAGADTAGDAGEPGDAEEPRDQVTPPDGDDLPWHAEADYDIYLHDPALMDADEDNLWSPGEEARITVIMTNRGPDAHSYYPSARLETAHPKIEVIEDEWQLYAILPDQDVPMEFRVRAAPDVEVGTVVPFTAKVHALGCDTEPVRCPDPAPLEFSFTVGEPIVPVAETEILLTGAESAVASYSEGGFPTSWSTVAGGSVPLGRVETEPHRSYHTALRFEGVQVPPGARVVSARLSFHPTNEVDSSNNLWINVYAESAANSATFAGSDTGAAQRPDQRERTSAHVDHWLVRCNAQCTEDTEYDCPQRKLDCWDRELRFELPKDLAPLVQEVVDLPGWAAGNALTVLLVNSATDEDGPKYRGSRSIVGWASETPDRAPLLSIEVAAEE